MLPSSVTRVKKSKATGDTLTFTAASVHTSFNNNTELKLGHVLKSFFWLLSCLLLCKLAISKIYAIQHHRSINFTK